MSGAVAALDDIAMVGWAMIDECPSYPPLVHLVANDIILASMIADGIADAVFDLPETARGYRFRFELGGYHGIDRSAFRAMIAESQEVLRSGFSDADGNGGLCPATYRDGLDAGLRPEDVVEGFYLDFLRRPADPRALHDFAEKARTDLVISIENWRRSVIESDEYKNKRQRVGDAVGRIFASTVLVRTSRRIRSFETCLPVFLADRSCMDAKLIGFFPGLLIRPLATSEIERAIAAGLPQREIFFRALALLADRPALVLDPMVLRSDAAVQFAGDGLEAGEHVVPCRSPLFASGWHKVETDGGGEQRWMEQIGVLYAPALDAPVSRIEVEIVGIYGDMGRVMAATESEVLDTLFAAGETSITLVMRSRSKTSFRLRRLVLLAEHARCPWRHQDQADPRLLSIRVRAARFVTGEHV